MKRSEPVQPQPVRAAAYVRMSTRHQQYSTSNQLDVIREYAAQRQMEVVSVYSDEGKSGLNIRGREAFRRMLDDVKTGRADFSCILVYDVSRWGRFQDQDERGHHKHTCRRAGIAVHYCAEQFENDGSPVSAIVEGVKGVMSSEYSRELSTKVFQGACRLIQLGFKQGGTAGYGLRRMLVDSARQHKGTLKIGEHKSIQTDRVILVPGPPEEVQTVRWMYEQFVHAQKNEAEIARLLNVQGTRTEYGRVWTRGTVHEVLTNEKYIGNNVYHRTSFKLKDERVTNPPEKWVRAQGVFEPLVEPNVFFMAHGIILARSRKLTEAEMLDKLRDVLKQHGRISGILIDEAEGLPSSAAFRHRFGSLVAAYQLIGYDPQIDYRFIEINRRLRQRHPKQVAEIIEQLRSLGATAVQDKETGLLYINDELYVSVVLCRHQRTPAGSSRWLVRLDEGLKPDLTIAVRMDAANENTRDFYLLPALDMTWENLRVAEQNGVYLGAYRFDTLDYFFAMAERVFVEDFA